MCVSFFALHYRVSELEETSTGDELTTDSNDTRDAPTAASGGGVVNQFTVLDRKGVALGCFVLARCLQLGQAVAKNDHKAQEYYTKAIKFDKKVVAGLHDKLTYGQL